MLVRITHPDGKIYQIPVAQVVVYTDEGQPCAISYECDGMVIHTNVGHDDFSQVLNTLKISPIKRQSQT